MSQISPSEASDLLKKLFDERVPVTAFFVTPCRARIRVDGFVVGATRETGLFIGDILPPAVSKDWINVFPFGLGECIFTYGERREIVNDVRLLMTLDLGESALIMRFVITDETLTLFFTI